MELEKVDNEMHREERWEKIRSSRFNRWYGRVKEEGIPGYLKKDWAENRWKRMLSIGWGGGKDEGGNVLMEREE